MDSRNYDSSRGSGRGRPIESDLRRPFGNTYANEDYDDYIPTEGSSSNGVHLSDLNQATRDLGIYADSQMERPMFQMVHPDPTGDHGRREYINRIITQPKSVLSPHAKEFFPRNFQPEPRNITIPAPMAYDDSFPIEELRRFMYEVTLNPGAFEYKLESLMHCLLDHVKDIDNSRGVLNVVFEESVRQSNFRYNGARLSKTLCKDLNIEDEEMSFKQLLIKRCNQEHNRREQLVDAADGGEYLRGFALYLAELFSQLEIHSQRIPIFADHLYSIMSTLLSRPSSDNLKCICQILKLVGAYLEDVEKHKSINNRNAPDMEKLIGSLKDIADRGELPRDICAMVLNVVDLQSASWGRMPESAEPANDQQLPPTDIDGPVMYGPDGQPISAEESLFLHSQLSHQSSDPDDYEGYEENPQDDFTDDEVQEAYNVFLNDLAQKLSSH